RFLRAIDIDALAILARRVEERADDARIDVSALEPDVRTLDVEGAAVFLDELLAHRAGTEAAYVFRRLANQPGDRTHAVGGVPHRRETRPVIGPTVHVLLMAR